MGNTLECNRCLNLKPLSRLKLLRDCRTLGLSLCMVFPRIPVIRLNEYNKLTENDGPFIPRWRQQIHEGYDSTCDNNSSSVDMHWIIVKNNLLQNL